ncbi:hypothetical protein F4808DRAFT_417567 [Astrocystis sublimbata]|nr:hypothetical protein F4808DRAFT_417567 [Astrocystis sublimbata]
MPTSIPWVTNGAKGNMTIALLVATPIVLPVAYAAYVIRQCAQQTSVSTSVSTSISPPGPLVGRGRCRRRRESMRTKGQENLDAAEDEEEGEEKGGEDDEEVGEDGILGFCDTRAFSPSVLAASEEYVVARERVVSEAVLLGDILPDLISSLHTDLVENNNTKHESTKESLLNNYLATTFRTFTYTPQSYIMKYLVSRLQPPSHGAALAETFSAAYLDKCAFEKGDRVCGVYVVRERVSGGEGRGERVLLDLAAPEGWKGPVVGGVLDCGFVVEELRSKGGEGRGEMVVRFVNETTLWRKKDERPTLLEGWLSRLAHTAMVRWMVVRGVEAVTRRVKERRD